MAGSPAMASRLEAVSDRLSPMLIKELRQGMKSKGFSLAFLLMQGLLVFSVLLGSAEASTHTRSLDASQVVFWFCISLPLLVIMPLRALFALQQEFRGNTLELIFLTRLSAWRIVIGKWFALFSQSLLLATGILPYLLLRYFLGGIDVALDLQLYVGILFGSALLCAAGVCLSSYRSTGVRVLAGIAAFVLPFYTMAAIGNSHGMGARSSHVVHEGVVMAGYLAAAALLTLLLLVWAADRIGPPAFSLAPAKRLLTLLITGWCALAAWYTGVPELLFQSMLVILPVCVEALSEPMRAIPSLYRGRTALGRWFLSPGWAPASIFTIVLLAFLYALAALIGISDADDWAMLLNLPAALLGPLALIVWFRPHTRRLTSAYIVLQLILLVVGFVCISIHAFKALPLYAFSILPTTSFILAVFERRQASEGLMLTGLAAALILATLALRLIQALRQVRPREEAPQASDES